MGKLYKNKELYDYLEKNYSTFFYRFEHLFGHMFPYKKLDLDKVTNLKISGVSYIFGIEELKNLKKIEINNISNFSALEKCSNIKEIRFILPDNNIDIDSLERISKLEGLTSFELYGRGLKNINSEEVKKISDITRMSYDELSLFSFNPEQFSKIQKRYEEIHSLITSDMTEFDIVKTIYKNLLIKDFKYDFNSGEKGSNGFRINNTMYGPLVENKGVCVGISQALEYALKNEGIDAVSCGGWLNTKAAAGDMHQWNQVKVDGKWYNLDLTNDFDRKIWKYFMKSDKDPDWSECHYRDLDDKYEDNHECTSTLYDNLFKEKSNEEIINELKEQQELLQKEKENIKIEKNNRKRPNSGPKL